jgi:hypothetical protein
MSESMVKQVWQRDFNNATALIQDAWIFTAEDGSTWINPEHANETAVQLQRKLALVGFARGWMELA